jgi:hypothetical protein
LSDEWLTYEEVAERLHVTVRAARARAFRGLWSKTQGNDGRARVRLPDKAPNPPRVTTVRPTESAASALLHALEAHNTTLMADVEALRAQLAAERAMTEKAVAAFVSIMQRLDALAAERAKPWWRRLAG